jgi:diguanylate cyclase (GGDEF)-like protein/PAS domain S-box-containing protein
MEPPSDNQGVIAADSLLLRQFVNWSIPVVALISAIGSVTVLWSPSWRFTAASLISLMFFGSLLRMRQALRDRNPRGASATLGVSMLLTSIFTAPLVPEALPVLATAPFSAVAVTLPYLGREALRRMVAFAWLANLLVVALALSAPAASELDLSPITIAAILVGGVTLPLVLLLQHHQHLTQLLERADSANSALQRYRTDLETQVQERTAELEEREARYRAISELTSDYVYSLRIERDGHVALEWITESFTRVTGHTIATLGSPAGWLALFHPDDRATATRHIEKALAGHSDVCELRFRTPRGDSGWLRLYARPLYESTGRTVVGVLGAGQDISEAKRATEELEQVLATANCLLWYAQVEEHGGALVWDLRVANELAAQQVLPLDIPAGGSYNDAWYPSKHPEDREMMDLRAEAALRAGTSSYSQEFRCRTRDGELRWLREDVRIERLGEGRWRLAGVCTDISIRKQAEEILLSQATRDPLTGLYNRRYMEESLERELHRAARQQKPLGVMLVDLDHFKRFNDLHGHLAGDELLRGLGAFLQQNIRANDIACRYGGEEFTLILPDSSLEDTRRRAEELREGVRALVVRYRQELLGGITLSIGVAAYPDHGTSGDELLHEADRALYRAKGAGRNRVAVALSPSERGSPAA